MLTIFYKNYYFFQTLLYGITYTQCSVLPSRGYIDGIVGKLKIIIFYQYIFEIVYITITLPVPFFWQSVFKCLSKKRRRVKKGTGGVYYFSTLCLKSYILVKKKVFLVVSLVCWKMLPNKVKDYIYIYYLGCIRMYSIFSLRHPLRILYKSDSWDKDVNFFAKFATKSKTAEPSYCLLFNQKLKIKF